MNILVTGGAGFIGSHLCKRLLSLGHRVICVDNFITSSPENIAEIRRDKNFLFINHDITKPLKVSRSLDWVMHLASPASPKDYLMFPIKTLKVGTLGTHNCLGLAKHKRARFFLASTSEVYGDPLVSPQPEEYWGNVNPIGVRSCYDESKRAAEALSFAYKREHGVDIKVIRIFNTYGPFMRIEDGRVVSNFIFQALTGKDLTVYGRGNQTRSFCYVDDLIDGIIAFMKIDHPGPLNLGTPFEFSVLELAKMVLALTHSKSKVKYLPLPADDPKQRKPDLTKAKKLIAWQPRVTLEDGLMRTIGYFQAQLKKKR
ncbi:MAG: UDP-glucuronic acid decarboxylase family protein [Candidatus Omnitrophota bacterium]|jgi:dTDP-glucose 4,6-dehydratase